MIQNVLYNSFINFQGRKPKYSFTEKQLAMRFEKEGLTLDDAKKIVEKFSKLKDGSPYTMEYNIREFVKLQAKEGLTVEQHLEAAKKQPSLFASAPSTLSDNIDEIHRLVSQYGIPKSRIIEVQNINPILRAMSGCTIVRNLTDIPKEYKSSGLKEEEYVKAAFKDLYLLGVPLTKFNGNMNAYLENLSDLNVTKKDLIKTFKKQHVLVTMSADNIINKLNLWRYIEENKAFDSNQKVSKKSFRESLLRKNLSHSIDSIMMYLLRCKLKSYYGAQIPSKKIKAPLEKLLKENSNKIYELPILKGTCAEAFERFASNFSIQTVGKNLFKMVIK